MIEVRIYKLDGGVFTVSIKHARHLGLVNRTITLERKEEVTSFVLEQALENEARREKMKAVQLGLPLL